MSNAVNKIAGTVKEQVGKVIGNERMQVEGEAKKREGERATTIKKDGHATATDKAHGQANRALGGTKEHIGAAVGSENLQGKGIAQKTEGTAQKTGQHNQGQYTGAAPGVGGTGGVGEIGGHHEHTAQNKHHHAAPGVGGVGGVGGHHEHTAQDKHHHAAPHALDGEAHYGGAGVPIDRKEGHHHGTDDLGHGNAGYTVHGSGADTNQYAQHPQAKAQNAGQAAGQAVVGQYGTGTHPQDQSHGLTGKQEHGQYTTAGGNTHTQGQGLTDIHGQGAIHDQGAIHGQGNHPSGLDAKEHGQYTNPSHPLEQGQTGGVLRQPDDHVRQTGGATLPQETGGNIHIPGGFEEGNNVQPAGSRNPATRDVL